MYFSGDYILGRIERSIEIKAPPEKVWEMLALDRLPKWADYPGMPVKYTSEVHTPKDKYRVGATAQGIPEKSKDEYCRYEILESFEHKRIKYREWENSIFGRLSMLTTYTIEPVGTNTKLTCETETEKFWGIVGKFLEKVYYRRWAEKQIQKTLEKLKNILEK